MKATTKVGHFCPQACATNVFEHTIHVQSTQLFSPNWDIDTNSTYSGVVAPSGHICRLYLSPQTLILGVPYISSGKPLNHAIIHFGQSVARHLRTLRSPLISVSDTGLLSGNLLSMHCNSPLVTWNRVSRSAVSVSAMQMHSTLVREHTADTKSRTPQ